MARGRSTAGGRGLGAADELSRHLVSYLAGKAMDLGALAYRPVAHGGADQWDDEFAAGLLDHYDDIDEAPRFGLLLGYVVALGGSPRILDVGCGVGLLRTRLGAVPFSSYTGLDSSLVAIERARRLDDERTRFVVGSSPAVHGPVDLVICSEMLYYVKDLEPFVAELFGALVPGGHLLTSVFRHRGDGALHRSLSRFDEIDAATATSIRGRKGWRVGLYQRPLAD